MALVVALLALLVSCGDESEGGKNPNTPPTTEEEWEDIKVVAGKVRFYLSEQPEASRTASGLPSRDWAESKVLVNSKIYDVKFTAQEPYRPYIEVDAADDYSAVLISDTSNLWYDRSLFTGVRLPHSLFESSAREAICSMPMYASYSSETGNKLIFADGFALLRFRVKGDADIASIRIETLNGAPITGVVNYLPSKGGFSVAQGIDFAVLNCTNGGKFAKLSTSRYRDFYLPVAPGFYADGVKISICDSQHLAECSTTVAQTLKAGECYNYNIDYQPDEDLVFYEGFDRCVWGGNIVKGAKGIGFSPTAEKVDITSGGSLSGYEYAFAQVPYDQAGTGFVQSNTWSDIDGKSVGESHLLSESYVQSRGFADSRYMFRVQECPGYIAIGAGSPYRGVYCSPVSAKMGFIGRMNLKLRFALQAGFGGVLHVEILDGGIIESAWLGGKSVELTTSNLKYQSSSSILTFKPEQLDIPSSAESGQRWSELELVITNAGESTRLYINDENMSSGNHGIYIDSIESRCIDHWQRLPGTLRVMVWNLQAGMWCDQHNNYDNFVAWIKRYDPDVCIWLESESSAPSNSASGTLPENEKFLPNGWNSLAARYGHSYVGRGGDRDNGSQTITSKYPITTLQRLVETQVAGKPLFHGAGHFAIDVNGYKVNVVSLHLWYESYAFGVDAANQAASTAASGGDYYRLHETEYIVNSTVNNPEYGSETLWLLCGDMNSRSRRDNWLYGYSEESTHFLSHDFVAAQTNLVDLISDCYPSGSVMASTSGLARLDFIYSSPAMRERVSRSATLIDSWCMPVKNGNARDWLYPSDHRPLLVDFDMR